MTAVDPKVATRIAELVAAAPELFPVRRYAPQEILEARREVAWVIYKLYPYPRAIADAMGVSQWTVWGWIKDAPKTRTERTRMPARHTRPATDNAVAIEGVEMTLEEVGKRLGGLVRERARQIEERALARLRFRAARGERLVVDLREAGEP